MIESNLAMIPDHAIIQIWARWPKKMLPEDQPGTLTNLVLKYGKARRALTRVLKPVNADRTSSNPQHIPFQLLQTSVALSCQNRLESCRLIREKFALRGRRWILLCRLTAEALREQGTRMNVNEPYLECGVDRVVTPIGDHGTDAKGNAVYVVDVLPVRRSVLVTP